MVAARRPVDCLLDAAPVGPRWCLVHATHMTTTRPRALARSGAVAGLCPTTEANLGDGLFNARRLPRMPAAASASAPTATSRSARSRSCAGWNTASGCTSAAQRLVAASEAERHCGARLWQAALAGGAQALGRRIGRLAPGDRADLVRLDADHPLLFGRSGLSLLDSLVFSGNANPVQDVMVGGRWRVRDGRHADREPIAAAYRRTVARLA